MQYRVKINKWMSLNLLEIVERRTNLKRGQRSNQQRPYHHLLRSNISKICTQRRDSFPYCTRKGNRGLNMSARSQLSSYARTQVETYLSLLVTQLFGNFNVQATHTRLKLNDNAFVNPENSVGTIGIVQIIFVACVNFTYRSLISTQYCMQTKKKKLLEKTGKDRALYISVILYAVHLGLLQLSRFSSRIIRDRGNGCKVSIVRFRVSYIYSSQQECNGLEIQKDFYDFTTMIIFARVDSTPPGIYVFSTNARYLERDNHKSRPSLTRYVFRCRTTR